MKPHWEISQQEADACLAATEWCPAIHEYFRGGGYSSRFLTEGGVPFTMTRVNIIKGLGTGTANRGRLERGIAEGCMTSSTNAPTQPGQPPGLHRASPVKGRLRMCTR